MLQVTCAAQFNNIMILEKIQYIRRTLRMPFLQTPPPRKWRPPWLPFWMRLHSEKVLHAHAEEEKSGLFLTNSAAGSEMEVLNWLYAFVCLVKPETILETGTADGAGTLALAAACRDNGFGVVHSVDSDPVMTKKAYKRLKYSGLHGYVRLHTANSLDFLRSTSERFDFAFYDSDIAVRCEEYSVCNERKLLHGTAVFHDTSPHRTRTEPVPPADIHERYRRSLYEAATSPGSSGYFESPLSRGVIAIFRRVDIQEHAE
jgi:predicted O-methyltransferase YrrM